MPKRLTAAIILAAISCPSTATAKNPVIEDVASAIEDNFFDAKQGEQIGNMLRERNQRDEFRGLAPELLAAKLTEILSAYDNHFRVDWTSDTNEDDASADRNSGSAYSFETILEHSGWGIRSVRHLPGNVGYVELSDFGHIDFDNPEDPVKKAADSVLRLLEPADALIVDIRANGGGAPSLVGYLVSAFAARDADIYNTFRFRGGQANEAPAVAFPSPELDEPLYILTSPRTASAAESFAYTLQAAGRAVIVGETSRGAANPGRDFAVTPNLSVFVSTGAPVNPITKKNWESTGVTPDIDIPAANALDAAHRLALAASIEGGDASPDAAWALDALSASPMADSREFEGQYGPWDVQRFGDTLSLQHEKRLAVTLIPIGTDVFFDRENPGTRYTFVRKDGDIHAVERRTAFGSVRVKQKDRP